MVESYARNQIESRFKTECSNISRKFFRNYISAFLLFSGSLLINPYTNSDFLKSEAGLRYREDIYINANINEFRKMLNAPLSHQSESVRSNMAIAFPDKNFQSLDQVLNVVKKDIDSIENSPEYKAYKKDMLSGMCISMAFFIGSLGYGLFSVLSRNNALKKAFNTRLEELKAFED